MVQLSLKLLLDHGPAVFCMRDHAFGAVFKSGGQDAETAGTVKQKERAVAEEAGLPVIQPVAGQKLTLVVDEMFIAHIGCLLLSAFPDMFVVLKMFHAVLVAALAGRAVSELHRNIVCFGHAADSAFVDITLFFRLKKRGYKLPSPVI